MLFNPYPFNLTVTNQAGCFAISNDIIVTAHLIPQVTSFTPATGCTGDSVTITGQYFTDATAVSFNGTAAGFVVVSDNEIHAAVPAGATSGFITVTGTGSCEGTSSTSFTVDCGGGPTLNLTLYLQGYYLGGGQMQPVLANQLVAGATGAETDTIYVELRDATDPTIVTASAPVLLMTDGTASVTFSSSVSGNQYIAVKHRNTLQTWSTNPVTMSGTVTYNFSTASSQAYADNMIEVETGVWAFYTGDLNQDEFIDPFDFPIFDADNFALVSFDYYATDLNGDGFVDPFDFPIYDGNNFNLIFSIHP